MINIINSQDNIINWDDVLALSEISYLRRPNSTFPNIGEGSDDYKHHIIDSALLGKVWNKSRDYLKILCDLNNQGQIDEDRIIIRSLIALNQYIIRTDARYNNAEAVLSKMIWNPGNIVMGPNPNNRTNDPHSRNNYDADLISNNDADVNLISNIRNLFDLESNFSDEIIRNLDYEPLVTLANVNPNFSRNILLKFRNVLKVIQLILTRTDQNQPQEANQVKDQAKMWQKFWEYWLAIYQHGYLEFDWENGRVSNFSRNISDRDRSRGIQTIALANLHQGLGDRIRRLFN